MIPTQLNIGELENVMKLNKDTILVLYPYSKDSAQK